MIFRRLHIATLIVAVVVSAIGCDYREPASRAEGQPRPNAPIDALAEYATGRVVDNMIIGGVVRANDRGGNFYQSIVVEDATGAVEVQVGLYDLDSRFPVGAEVVVDAEGLAVGYYDGVLQLGREPYDYSLSVVEPLGSPVEVDRRMGVATWSEQEPPQPANVVVAELTDDMCGRLVRVVGVEYLGEPTDWGSTDWGTIARREFLSAEGDTLVVATSRYADFATEPIPEGKINLCGVLYHPQGGHYTLKMRTVADVEE